MFQVREYETVDVPLRDLLTEGALDVDAGAAGRYFTFQFKRQELRLQAGGFIGYIPINDRVAVDVRPRCPIANLARVLGVGGFAPHVIETYARRYGVDPSELPSLRDLFARSLLDEIHFIEASGLLREYRLREERTSSPRGRLVLRAPETQLAAAGWSPSVRAAWYERTADTPANRCLKMAIYLLARSFAQTRNLTAQQRKLVVGLNNVYPLFEDAGLDRRLDFLGDASVVGSRPLPTTRSYYRNALDIARLVVRGVALAFDEPGREVRMPSVVIQMDKVFEAYIRNVLQEATAGYEFIDVADGNREGAKLLYDAQPSQNATPDVVVSAAGIPAVVLDVKYKPASAGPDRADLNQVIAYGVSYRATSVVIIQPRAQGSARSGLVRLGDIEDLGVYQYVFDLAADLDAEERALVAEIVRLAGGDATTEPPPQDLSVSAAA